MHEPPSNWRTDRTSDGGFSGRNKKKIYWPAIKRMRNLFAHNYGAVDVERVWETVHSDILQLLEFCEQECSKVLLYRAGGKRKCRI